MVARRTVGGVALAVFVPAAYFAAVTFLLYRSGLEIYGFRVSPDVRTVIEIVLRVCPFIAALFMILLASWRDGAVSRLANGVFARRSTGAYTFATLGVSVLLAVVTLVLTAFAIAVVCGTRGDVAATTLLWLAAGFTFDVTLIGIFTMFLHALTRRTWATFLLFVLYAVVVVVFGTRWHLTSFIGFASTVPARLSSYSRLPLYPAAEWLFRAYWTSVALILLVVLHRFREKAILSMGNGPVAEAAPQRRYGLKAAGAVYAAVAICLLQLQQCSVAKYRVVSPRRLGVIASGSDRDTRLRLSHYDLALDYHPDGRTVAVSGTLSLESDPAASMRSAYLQLPFILTVQSIRLDAAGPHRLTRLQNYIRIEWPAAVPPRTPLRLSYSGTIRPAGPFDLNVYDKVLANAFFVTDSDLLIAPRRPACIAGAAAPPPSCEAENYTTTDKATGLIRVSVPPGYSTVGPGDGGTAAHGQSLFRVDPPQLSKFLVAAAHFSTTSVPASEGLPAVRVVRANSERTPLAGVGRAVVSRYQTEWPPYRHSQLTIVETPAPLGEAVTFDGLVALSDRMVRSRDPFSGGASNLAEFVLAHEISHQWWGYEVVPTRAPGELFVLESFAQFSAYKYLESRRILTAGAARQNEAKWYARARSRSSKPEPALASIQQSDLALAYHKGPLALLSLDKMTGNALMLAFGQVLRRDGCESCPPLPPRQIVTSVIEQLPPSRRWAAQQLLLSAPDQAPPGK